MFLIISYLLTQFKSFFNKVTFFIKGILYSVDLLPFLLCIPAGRVRKMKRRKKLFFILLLLPSDHGVSSGLNIFSEK